MNNSRIVAALGSALAISAGVASAANDGPTPLQAFSAPNQIFIAGPPAAAQGVFNAFVSRFCLNQVFSFFGTPLALNLPDFRAVSCLGTTINYRAENSSVVGVLPVINNTPVKFMEMTNDTCALTTTPNTYSCTGVTGSATSADLNDSWGGWVLSHTVDIGVSDLEPGVFGTSAEWAGGGRQNPVMPQGLYPASFIGPARTAAELQAMTHTTIFQQVYGFVVHSNLTFTDLPKEQIAAIFDGLVSDWNQVTLANNTAAGNGKIVVCHEAAGSGTRAAVDIFLNNVGCGISPGSLQATDTATEYLEDGPEIDCVNRNFNAIGYVRINYFAKSGTGNEFASTKPIAVSGISASPAHAGSGGYGLVYEASINKNAHASVAANSMYSLLVGSLQNVNQTVPGAQVVAIPGQPVSNRALTPLQTGSIGVMTSDFIRAGGAGNSCTPLTDVHE